MTLYNTKAKELMIDRVTLGEINDIVLTLAHSDIVVLGKS